MELRSHRLALCFSLSFAVGCAGGDEETIPTTDSNVADSAVTDTRADTSPLPDTNAETVAETRDDTAVDDTTTDSADGSDVTDAIDAADATDASDSTDASDATDAADASDAFDATDATDAADSAPDVTDTADTSDTADASDTADSSDSGAVLPCPTSTTSLELCITFASVTGSTVNDGSGKARNGTLSGGATIVDGGKFGKAVEVTTGASVLFGKVIPLTGALTVEVWAKPNGTQASWATLVSKWESSGGYWLGGSSPAGGYEWWIGGTFASKSTALVADTWQHVAGSWNPSTKKILLYVNGVEAGTADWTDTALPTDGSSVDLELAGSSFGGEFKGLLDELRIFSVVRTQAEICTDAGGTATSGGGCTL